MARSRSNERLVPGDGESPAVYRYNYTNVENQRTAAAACLASAEVYALDGNNDQLEREREEKIKVQHHSRTTAGNTPYARGRD